MAQTTAQQLSKRVIACYNKGINPKEIAVVLNKEGFTRATDGEPLRRKDINNKITGLKKLGLITDKKLLPKSSNQSPKNSNNKDKGNKTKGSPKEKTVTNLTIQEVVKLTGLTQGKIAEQTKTAPGTIVTWKKKGIPAKYIGRFETLVKAKGTPAEAVETPTEVVATSKPKRAYNKKKKTPTLTQVTPEEIGMGSDTDATILVVTRDKAVISELISRFI